MSDAENETVVWKLLECVIRGDTANIGNHVSDNWVNHDPTLPGLKGVEEAKQLASIWKAFSDVKSNIDDMISHYDRVAARFTLSGEHSGTVMGIPATGKSVNFTGTCMSRIVSLKSTDYGVNFDGLGQMVQLGVVTPPNP